MQKNTHSSDMNSVIFGESMPQTRRMPSSVVTLVWKNFLIMILVQINHSFKLVKQIFPRIVGESHTLVLSHLRFHLVTRV